MYVGISLYWKIPREAWNTRQSYELYRSSDAFQSLYTELATFSTTFPLLRQCCNLITHLPTITELQGRSGWPTITVAYFPSPLSDAQRSRIRAIRGMYPGHIILFDSPLYSSPMRAFFATAELCRAFDAHLYRRSFDGWIRGSVCIRRSMEEPGPGRGSPRTRNPDTH